MRRLADIDAGVVDEDVDPSEFAPDVVGHSGDSGLVGDIGDHGYRFGAALPEFGGRGIRLRLVAPDDRDSGTGFRQPARHAKADAAIAAGDDRHLATEIEC